MLGISPSDIVAENKGHSSEVDEGNGEDDKYDGNDDSDELYYDDWFSEDSVWTYCINYFTLCFV